MILHPTDGNGDAHAGNARISCVVVLRGPWLIHIFGHAADTRDARMFSPRWYIDKLEFKDTGFVTAS